MCGILAFIGTQLPKELLDDKLKLMSHRGPDYSSSIQFESVYLGHNRLAIIDLAKRSNQPFPIGQCIIIYNGEIYNYKELIKEHRLNPVTESDTEVLLLMYLKYKENCLKYFNGMFSFVIYNRETKDTFIARDRLGIKPLYIFRSKEQIIVSSEIKPILELIKTEIDPWAVRQYKKIRMTVHNYTMYKKIKFFPPGYYLYNNKFTQYWKLDVSPKKPPNDEYLYSLIDNAVRIRKRSDVPLGSYLSGGLDSTILSYLLEPNFTYTVGFDELNEFEWANIANNKLSSTHIQVKINTDEYIETLKYMINIRKEPLSVPNEVLIYLMTKEVKKNNTVMLSGEGADELFYGYDRIYNWANNKTNLDILEFDKYYSYGSHNDIEVLEFALQGLPGDSVLEKVSYFFQIHHLHGLLRRLDNSTMLCSVEARVPFVDHRLVELIAGTPFNWRVNKTSKAPLKRIFKKLIPKEIIERKKVGFPVPLQLIFGNQQSSGKNPMDIFLDFNLKHLNIDIKTSGR